MTLSFCFCSCLLDIFFNLVCKRFAYLELRQAQGQCSTSNNLVSSSGLGAHASSTLELMQSSSKIGEPVQACGKSCSGTVSGSYSTIPLSTFVSIRLKPHPKYLFILFLFAVTSSLSNCCDVTEQMSMTRITFPSLAWSWLRGRTHSHPCCFTFSFSANILSVNHCLGNPPFFFSLESGSRSNLKTISVRHDRGIRPEWIFLFVIVFYELIQGVHGVFLFWESVLVRAWDI